MIIFVSRIAKNRLALLGGGLILFIIFLVIIVPYAGLRDPNLINTSDRFKPPFSSGYMLGADHLGRDLLSRLLWGTRLSLAVGFAAAMIATVVGTFIGILAGYFRGILDDLLMRSIDVLMAFPYVLLALAIVAVMGPGLFNSLIAVSIVNIPFFARNVRGMSLVYTNADFMKASMLSGRSTLSLILFELLPNLLPTIIVAFSTTIGWMILETAGLSFLGLGSQPPQADLGSMLGEGRSSLIIYSHNSLIPGAMILFIVMGFNLLGDGVRDALDPKLAKGDLGRSKAFTDVSGERETRELDSNKILQISNLTTEFQDGPKRARVVEKLSFSLEKEECLAIVGQSGSGKSVTALSLTGLVPSPPGIITGGSVNYLGEDILKLPIKSILGIRGRKIAYIFQDPQSSLHPLKTINAQISEAIFTHRSLDRKEIQIEVLSLLKKVRIAEPERVMISYPHQLSGGMRQRIGIAMALANKPDIIIADEPTTALDVTIQAGILALLNELRKDFKMSMIFISHDLNVVSQISDKVIVMLKGKIVEHGSTAQIMTKPRHAYTKRLLSCSPQFRKSNEFLNNTN